MGERLEKEILDDYYEGRYILVEGGSTVGLRSIMLSRYLGFTEIHMFGFDGCYMNKKHHAYPQEANEREKTDMVEFLGKKFEVSVWMMRQYQDFINLIRYRGNLFELHVHGNGLFAHVLREMTSPKMRVKLWFFKWFGRLGVKIGIPEKYLRQIAGVPDIQEGQDGSTSMETLQQR